MRFQTDRVKWGKWDSGVSGTLEGNYTYALVEETFYNEKTKYLATKWMPPWRSLINIGGTIIQNLEPITILFQKISPWLF